MIHELVNKILPLLESDRDVQNVKKISQLLRSEIKELNFKRLSTRDFGQLEEIVDQVYLYFGNVAKSNPKKIAEIRYHQLAIKLGGHLDVKTLRLKRIAEYRKFLEVNHFHHKLMHLRLALPDKIAVPVELFSLRWVEWDKLNRVAGDNKIEFKFMGRVVFATDLNLKLLNDYTLTFKGIKKYNPYFTKTFIPYDKRDAKSWDLKYILEVWTGKKDRAFMVLKDSSGFVRCVGERVCTNPKNGCQKISGKNAYLVTPDSAVFMPELSNHYSCVTFAITKKMHDKMIRIVEEMKNDRNRETIYYHRNSTSLIIEILNEVVGIDLSQAVHCTHLLLKDAAPKFGYRYFLKPVISLLNKLPKFVSRTLYFTPFFYIPSLFIAVYYNATLSKNDLVHKRNLSAKNILFFPWRASLRIVDQKIDDLVQEKLKHGQIDVRDLG